MYDVVSFVHIFITRTEKMPEQHVDYRDLAREKKLEVLESLAHMAINIVARHPDILENSLLQAMAHKHNYGYVAYLGLFHAIKQGKIIRRDDGYHALLRIAQGDI